MSKIFSNALFEAKERESAVSPVVGVMLMLVVTIIIAATVSAFAGGLVGTSDKAPQAAFDVKILVKYGQYDDNFMTITHLGGDPIDTARTKIITSWTNKTTKDPYYSETAALPFSKTPQNNGQIDVNFTLTDANYNTTYSKYQEPYFVIPNTLPGGEVSIWYGNFILHPGDVMQAQGSLASYNTYGKEHAVIKNVEQLSGKDVVNVKLVDIPTGQIIYDKDIYVVEG